MPLINFFYSIINQWNLSLRRIGDKTATKLKKITISIKKRAAYNSKKAIGMKRKELNKQKILFRSQ